MLYSLVGFSGPVLAYLVLSGIIFNVVWSLKRDCKTDGYFDTKYKAKLSVMAFGTILVAYIVVSLLWFLFEPVSFGLYSYYSMQFLACMILSDIFSLGIMWKLKGQKNL